ncbi:calcium/sodium antiporter [Pseudoalteromonas sp. Cn5-37]|uniref:calcium/sodium antiporter n=1 Tax=unclassified Pseudoalteromonas TaxID=194690 RepID=UPI00110B47B1|nr:MULTISPECIES: calcium/sodium antiporter [unclassified Pseudoalteromonas]MCF2918227.1 calcium/sodium antiporter [Pseudoalteromonas sp. Cn5-37]TMP18669.1 calcium/sodium antiporter [Pseudoalteromonas sp. S2721]|tara:strand:+ start:603 stop:1574 length:972 start_codon:yes stop_codon:yes gene_type:complete
MTLFILAILVGFVLLIWSADRFVDGAAVSAKYAGMPSLLIGMIVVGFGTSAPEMLVSAMAAADGSPELALGNALGSNIVNIGLILGITALIAPIAVHSNIVKKELPLLLVVSVLFALLIVDGGLSRFDAGVLLLGFFSFMGWSIYSGLKSKNDSLATDVEQELNVQTMSLKAAIVWLVVGLVVLIISSRLLVWGAVSIAEIMGISDLIIGLTIVALGTSLPELAASIAAARKGEHDIAIGNVIGSNIFNILAVTGIAGMIAPAVNLSPDLLSRDWLAMLSLSIFLLIFAYGHRGIGRVNRAEGIGLLLIFIAYNAWLLFSIYQ